MAGIEKCPHAAAARAAARIAEDLAAAAKDKEKAEAKKQAAAAATSSRAATAAGCPFHKSAAESSTTKPTQKAEDTTHSGFNYEKFYGAELEKKHKDQSYRYFNNINRLAAKFPVAHTGNVKEEVEVWCANDYLGMGNNPAVLETMQCV
jgi:5-aminolevulinate synthase